MKRHTLISLVAGLWFLIANINVYASFVPTEAVYYESTGMFYIEGTVNPNYAGTPVSLIIYDKALDSDHLTIDGISYLYQETIEQNGKYVFNFKFDCEIDDYTITVGFLGETSIVTVKKRSKIEFANMEFIAGDMDSDGNKQVTVRFDIVNRNDADITSAVVLAVIDEAQKMDRVITQTVSLTCGIPTNKSYTMTIPAQLIQSGHIRIFCFESLRSIRPLTQSIKLPVKDAVEKNYYLTNSEPIIGNPGKGWQIYGMPSAGNEELYDNVSVCYFRYNWNVIEPSEGQYNWAIVDDRINTIASYGKKAAFGVVNADPYSSGYVVPKWVYDAGARYTYSEVYPYSGGTLMQYIPVWDDPVFLSKLNNFVAALAEKYDGDPRIAYIDIRSYGSYGEGHLLRLGSDVVPLDFNGLKKHLSIYSNNFEKTQLMMPTLITTDGFNEYWVPKSEYLIHNKIGFRSDSIMQECDSGYVTSWANGYSPAVFELSIGYDALKTAGDGGSRQWNENMYIDSFDAGKPSYMDISSIGFYRDNQELVKLMTNKMGYHFNLISSSMPKIVLSEDAFAVTLNWENAGVTYLYEKCYPAIAILDSDNNVVQKTWLGSSEPNKWAPNKITTETYNIKFTDVANGAYTLAVGLYHDKTNENPVYKIGNYGVTSTGWYPVAACSFIEGAYFFDQIPAITLFEKPYYPTGEIQNPGFEESGNWSYGECFQITDEHWHEGANSLKIIGAATPKNAITTFKVAYGKMYELSFFANSSDAFSCGIYGSYGNLIESVRVEPTNGSWSKYSLSFGIADSSLKSDILELRITSCSGGVGYIDDFLLVNTGGIYEDGCLIAMSDVGFETNDRHWFGRNGSSVGRTNANPHSGAYCGVIYNRNDALHGAQIDITKGILENGPGLYKFEGWFRTAPGKGSMGINIYLAKYNSRYDFIAGSATISENWTYVSFEKEFTQSQYNNLMSAVSLIMGRDSSDAKKDIYFDDVRISKMN